MEIQENCQKSSQQYRKIVKLICRHNFPVWPLSFFTVFLYGHEPTYLFDNFLYSHEAAGQFSSVVVNFFDNFPVWPWAYIFIWQFSSVAVNFFDNFPVWPWGTDIFWQFSYFSWFPSWQLSCMAIPLMCLTS